jgi:tetratricopeptide (TPR) repeat protein
VKIILVATLGALAACAPAVREPSVGPADLPALERARASRPTDHGLLVQLGAAYYKAGRQPEAIAALRAALAGKADFPTLVYLGLAYESSQQPDSALAQYRRAGQLQLSAAERGQLEYRLASVTRQRLAVAAREAIQRETELSRVTPPPNTIAVLPWSYLGTNAELRPLERGITHLVVTDLSQVKSLVLLERERAQALADELKLTAAARVEPNTGARSGRLLRAARIVNGSVREAAGGANLRLDATAVVTTTGRVTANGTATNRLETLIAMEKQVVLALIDQLGITLSPAERQAISERPTADLQAFLAFSRGLGAEDRGDYAAAAAEFTAAAARDPNFKMAKDRAARSTGIAAAASQGAGGLERLATSELPGSTPPTTGRAQALANAIEIVAPSFGSRLALRSLAPLPLARPSLPEALRQDNPTELGGQGRVVIVIPRPL